MKLIYCNNCQDILRLHKTTSSCLCGESGGHYQEDGFNVIIYGPSIPLGFKNDEFNTALDNQPKFGSGREFTSYVIPVACPTVEHVNWENYKSTDDAVDQEIIDWLEDDEVTNKKKKIKNVYKDEK